MLYFINERGGKREGERGCALNHILAIKLNEKKYFAYLFSRL